MTRSFNTYLLSDQSVPDSLHSRAYLASSVQVLYREGFPETRILSNSRGSALAWVGIFQAELQEIMKFSVSPQRAHLFH